MKKKIEISLQIVRYVKLLESIIEYNHCNYRSKCELKRLW